MLEKQVALQQRTGQAQRFHDATIHICAVSSTVDKSAEHKKVGRPFFFWLRKDVTGFAKESIPPACMCSATKGANEVSQAQRIYSWKKEARTRLVHSGIEVTRKQMALPNEEVTTMPEKACVHYWHCQKFSRRGASALRRTARLWLEVVTTRIDNNQVVHITVSLLIALVGRYK